MLDLFAHSGTTLIASEILKRKCYTADIDPLFCEVSIRRLEHYRKTGRLGWQNGHPFEKELPIASGIVPTTEDLALPEIIRTTNVVLRSMEHLQQELDRLLSNSKDEEKIRSRLESLVSVYPFNEYEFIISHLLAEKILSFDQYLDLRDNYLSRNLYLYIFEISAPRTFGEAWAQGHLKGLIPELSKPTKKLDSEYRGNMIFFWMNESALKLRPAVRWMPKWMLLSMKKHSHPILQKPFG